MENIQTSVAPPEQNTRYVKSVEELQSQKQRMEMGLELELDEETKKLQQAYSKANHKLRQQVKQRMGKPLLTDGASSKGGEVRVPYPRRGASIPFPPPRPPPTSSTSCSANGADLIRAVSVLPHAGVEERPRLPRRLRCLRHLGPWAQGAAGGRRAAGEPQGRRAGAHRQDGGGRRCRRGVAGPRAGKAGAASHRAVHGPRCLPPTPASARV